MDMDIDRDRNIGTEMNVDTDIDTDGEDKYLISEITPVPGYSDIISSNLDI